VLSGLSLTQAQLTGSLPCKGGIRLSFVKQQSWAQVQSEGNPNANQDTAVDESERELGQRAVILLGV